MEKVNSSVQGGITNIRFNTYYSVSLIIVAVILTVLFLRVKEKDWYYILFLIFAVLFIINGVYALTGSKYVGLDKQNKQVIVYGFFGIALRKYKYDRLFFNDKELYREIHGKTKFINILRSQCKRNDLESFIAEVNKGV
jgi:hypothetical protein